MLFDADFTQSWRRPPSSASCQKSCIARNSKEVSLFEMNKRILQDLLYSGGKMCPLSARGVCHAPIQLHRLSSDFSAGVSLSVAGTLQWTSFDILLCSARSGTKILCPLFLAAANSIDIVSCVRWHPSQKP